METNKEMEKIFTPAVKEEAKKIAIISYLTIIGLIIAFVINNDRKFEFTTYHIKQSLGLAISGIALMLVGFIPILGWIINIIGFFVLIYMWIMGLMNAINQNMKPVPFLGYKFESWFKSI